MNESATPEQSATLSGKVAVFQEKAASFRVVHADGAWLSVNPYRNLHVIFYSERAPIPKSVQLAMNANSVWQELPTERDVKQGWFREMEVDVVLTLEGVLALQNALAKWIPILQEQHAEYDSSKKGT